MDSKELDNKKEFLELSKDGKTISDDSHQIQQKLDETQSEINESFAEVVENHVNNRELCDLMSHLNGGSNMSINIADGNHTPSFISLTAEEERKRNKKLSTNRNNMHCSNNVFENGLKNVQVSNNEGSSTVNNININEKISNMITHNFTPIVTNCENRVKNTQLINADSSLSSDFLIEYKDYESELQMQDIMRLIQAELSEPYSIYTYRYFIYNWPKLCFLAAHNNEYVGAIVCKLDMHLNVIKRGYIAMLAVKKEYRKMKIGTNLVQKAIEAMLADDADEVVLETEMKNIPALRLYENLGFVRDKRLFRYYLNGVDALRLKLWFR